MVLMDAYDRDELSRRHYRECLWLRDTLESVALELERMAAKGQDQTDILLGRTRRAQRRYYESPRDLEQTDKGLVETRGE